MWWKTQIQTKVTSVDSTFGLSPTERYFPHSAHNSAQNVSTSDWFAIVIAVRVVCGRWRSRGGRCGCRKLLLGFVLKFWRLRSRWRHRHRGGGPVCYDGRAIGVCVFDGDRDVLMWHCHFHAIVTGRSLGIVSIHEKPWISHNRFHTLLLKRFAATDYGFVAHSIQRRVVFPRVILPVSVHLMRIIASAIVPATATSTGYQFEIESLLDASRRSPSIRQPIFYIYITMIILSFACIAVAITAGRNRFCWFTTFDRFRSQRLTWLWRQIEINFSFGRCQIQMSYR